jgi:hypothetical protein
MAIDKVAVNKSYAAKLWWTPADFGATTFDQTIVAAINSYQKNLGVTEDGIAGPGTYAALLSFWQKVNPRTSVVAAGKIVVWELLKIWLTDIVDLPPKTSTSYTKCQATIDQMIRTHFGLNWTWEEPYDGSYEWCGAFCSRGWSVGNIPLNMRRDCFSSTLRLDRWARYRPNNNGGPNPPPADGVPRRTIISLDEHSTVWSLGSFVPQAGDILLVGPTKTGSSGPFLDYGRHITVVERFDPKTGMFWTVEGNGSGLGPLGQRQQGVIRATRPLGLSGQSPSTYHARRLIRVAPSDIGVSV